MNGDLEAHRRILFVAYRRYLAADRVLQVACSSALRWFPEAPARNTMLIGDPDSRIRRLYEGRDRALARLMLVRRAMEEAQGRVRSPSKGTRLFIEVSRCETS